MITTWNDDLPLSFVMNIDLDETNRETFDNDDTLYITDEQTSSNVCHAEMNFDYHAIACPGHNNIRCNSKFKNDCRKKQKKTSMPS